MEVGAAAVKVVDRAVAVEVVVEAGVEVVTKAVVKTEAGMVVVEAATVAVMPSEFCSTILSIPRGGKNELKKETRRYRNR